MLGALQIDPYGNINSSYVGGTYDRPGRRFAGAGGANGIASLCWRTLFVMMQEKRRFVPQLDFIWLQERIDPDRVVIGKGKTIRS